MAVRGYFGRPNDTCRAITQQIRHGDFVGLFGREKRLDFSRIAPRIAAEIEVGFEFVFSQIDQISRARAADIRQLEIGGIEQIGMVKNGRIAHGYFGSKTPVPYIRPVTHLPVADADNIRQAVAREIGQKNALFLVGKNDSGTQFFIVRFDDPFRRIVACFAFVFPIPKRA